MAKRQCHREEGIWAEAAVATSRFFEHRAEQAMRRGILRTRVDVQHDPLGLHNAEAVGERSTWGVDARCKGDERFLAVQTMLDQFEWERTDVQKLWHWHVTAACLPHIYGDDWPRECHRVLKSLGMKELRSEVLIMTPRRFGKTIAVSMMVCALLLTVPGIRISVISTGNRASGKVRAEVLRFLNQIPGARRRIVGEVGETLYVASRTLPDGNGSASLLAKQWRGFSDTSFLEVLPNNPEGE